MPRNPFYADFVAFTMAAIVTLLGAVPLGLGSFEATSIASLRLMGIPFEAALSATLAVPGPSALAAARTRGHPDAPRITQLVGQAIMTGQQRLERRAQARGFPVNDKSGRLEMYIGLGGLLVLILILWLLGVI